MATLMNRARMFLLRTALAVVAVAVLVASVGTQPRALSKAGAAALIQRLDAATGVATCRRWSCW